MSNLWEEIADNYARVSDDVRQRFLFPAIISLIRKVDTNRLDCLDYGCGPGCLAIKLADLFESLVLVDSAPNFLEEAHRRLGDRVVILDPENFKQHAQNFDTIVLSLVVTTIQNDHDAEGLLRMLGRRLNIGGRLIIGTTHPCFTFQAHTQVPYSSSGAPYQVPIKPGLDITEYHRPLDVLLNLVSDAGLHPVRTMEVYDTPDYYISRGEEPHRFAGLLPMFLLLTCVKVSHSVHDE